jgi:protoporphyrinogen/coproporphyrinogen III oxidase
VYRIAVVGGGIAGLAAAVRLRDQAPPGTQITVYEQTAALGGKLRTGELAGTVTELGADAFLTSDPGGGESAALRLARRVGLGDDLVHPAAVPAALAIGGELLPVPRGTLLGVPGDLAALPPVAHPDASLDRDGGPLLGPGEDVAVGDLVRRRLGDEVVDRLVEPMLGGVYAGRADRLSLAATIPRLAAAARVHGSLVAAVRAAQRAAPYAPGRVFTSIAGGLSRLATAAAVASGARLRLGQPVRELARVGRGWRLVLGPVPAPEFAEADGVVLAVPARPVARLLSEVDAAAAATIAALDYASVALVCLALPSGTALPELSGFLVPPGEGTVVKAATFLTRKWPHLHRSNGPVLVRASVGRHGDERLLQRADHELVDAVHRDLSALLGSALPAPLAARVQRWGGALPQYAPGHPDRVAAARAAVARHPGLAIAGAGYDGVGIPICVRSGEVAADEVITSLTDWTA